MSLLPKFIRASAWAAGTSYVFFAISFLGQILLARMLIPADFGVFAFCFAVSQFVTIFLGFATAQTFIYSEGRPQDFNACMKINFYAALFLGVIGLLGFSLLETFYSFIYAGMFFLLCLGQALTFIGNIYFAPLEKKLDYRTVSLAQGFANLVSMFIGIIIAWTTHSIWSLGFRQLLIGVFLILLGRCLSPMSYQFSLPGVKMLEQFSYGMKTALSRGLEVLYYYFPDIVVQFFMGKVALGNFYQARYLCFMPIKLTTPFTEQVLFSFLTNYKHDKKSFGENLFWVNYIVLRGLMLLSFIVYLYGQNIFMWIYGPQWVLAGKFFENFALFVLFGAAFNPVQVACCSLKLQRYASQAYFMGILVFVLGVAFAPNQAFSAFAFSFGFLVGYLYMLLKLKSQEVKVAIWQLMNWPCFLLLMTVVSQYVNLNKVTILFEGLFVFVLMLYIERKKIIRLFLLLKHLRFEKNIVRDASNEHA